MSAKAVFFKLVSREPSSSIILEPAENHSLQDCYFTCTCISVLLFVIRNKAGETALEHARRTGASSDILNILRQLEVQEERRRRVKHMGLPRRTACHVRWFITDIVHQLGWKVTLTVVIVITLIAWQLTVHYHGVNPLYTKQSVTIKHS